MIRDQPQLPSPQALPASFFFGVVLAVVVADAGAAFFFTGVAFAAAGAGELDPPPIAPSDRELGVTPLRIGASAVAAVAVEVGSGAREAVGFCSLDAGAAASFESSVVAELVAELSVVSAGAEVDSDVARSAVFAGACDAPQPAIMALVPKAARVS